MLGIDVSHYQGIIDWYKVSMNIPKIGFAFIKASQGASVYDPKFHYNSYEAKKFGLKIGYYHFATLNSKSVASDAQIEALWFLECIKKGPTPDLPLVLDIEAETPKIQLSDDEVVKWIETFFNTLQSSGIGNYALYSYKPFLDEHLPTNHNLGGIPLWLAAYTSNPAPKLPKGWNDYWVWQYSDDGRVDGINGRVDLNKTIKII